MPLDLIRRLLKGLVKIENNRIEISLIKIVSNKNSPKIEHDNSKTLQINVEKIPPAYRPKVLKLIREGVEAKDYALLEESAEKEVKEIKKAESSADTKKTLGILREYIPPADVPILRAALYLRYKFKQVAPPGVCLKLKGDIVERWGNRGAKISNLCTAGYFETMIVPLLNEMKKSPSFSKEIFRKNYEIIIAESGFSIFVRSGMGIQKIRTEALSKIKTNSRYGQKFLHIHGIGKKNIENIRNVVDQLLKELPGLEKISDDTIGNAIYVELHFGPELNQALSGSLGN